MRDWFFWASLSDSLVGKEGGGGGAPADSLLVVVVVGGGDGARLMRCSKEVWKLRDSKHFLNE